MPTYVYKFVETGETIEVQQGFHDDPLTEATHPVTGALLAVKKVFQPVGISFKGSGFYKTDSRSGSKSSSTSTPSSAEGAAAASTKSDAAAGSSTPPPASPPPASTPAPAATTSTTTSTTSSS
jgi:predicted nucleic acid-binding Zn ribbon protein